MKYKIVCTVFFQDEDSTFLGKALPNIIQPDEKLWNKMKGNKHGK